MTLLSIAGQVVILALAALGAAVLIACVVNDFRRWREGRPRLWW